MDKNKIKTEIFRRFEIWKYEDEKIIRYNFFEAVNISMYGVVSVDVFPGPVEMDSLHRCDSCFYDAIGSIDSVHMIKFCDNIEDAIIEFENEFS